MALEDQVGYAPTPRQEGDYGPQIDNYKNPNPLEVYSTETPSNQYGLAPDQLEDKTIENPYLQDDGINMGGMAKHNQEHNGIKVKGCWYCSQAFSQN